MATFVRMPQKGLTEESVILAKWYIAEGDVVKEGQYLFALETGKAAFDVEAEAGGTILKTFGSEGDEISVRKIVCVIGTPGESFVLPAEASSAAADIPAPRPETSSGTSGPAEFPAFPAAGAETVRISPRARRLASASGLDYSALAGTGPDGRIIEDDVKKALAVRPAAAPVREEYASVSHTHIRKTIAAAMTASLQSMAQFTTHARCDASELLAYRERWNAAKTPEEKLTINDMLAFALSRILPRFAYMNAHFYENETRLFTRVHLGVAVDTPRGLLVPVVKNADTKSLSALSREIKNLAGRCREGKAAPDELAGGTFTLSNIGSWGADYFTPIINPPEVGILGAGTIEYRRKKTDGGIIDYPALALSLTADHRAVDGAPAAAFLKALCGELERFSLLLV